MRVSAWEQERRDGVLRLSARVTWEDRDRADDVLWFEWPESLASSVSAEPDAALIAAYPLAMCVGERRLTVEGDVSPRLADGVRSAMAIVAEQSPAFSPVSLELSERSGPFVPNVRGARGCRLCGSFDSLRSLRMTADSSIKASKMAFMMPY